MSSGWSSNSVHGVTPITYAVCILGRERNLESVTQIVNMIACPQPHKSGTKLAYYRFYTDSTKIKIPLGLVPTWLRLDSHLVPT